MTVQTALQYILSWRAFMHSCIPASAFGLMCAQAHIYQTSRRLPTCPAAHCSFTLNRSIISNLVIRVCYQDNSISTSIICAKAWQDGNSGSNSKNTSIDENKINTGPEFRTPSTVDDLLLYRDLGADVIDFSEV